MIHCTVLIAENYPNCCVISNKAVEYGLAMCLIPSPFLSQCSNATFSIWLLLVTLLECTSNAQPRDLCNSVLPFAFLVILTCCNTTFIGFFPYAQLDSKGHVNHLSAALASGAIACLLPGCTVIGSWNWKARWDLILGARMWVTPAVT